MQQIKATIIAHSSYQTAQIITAEMEFPRFIHSEFMTHRLFSRNAASSRAIPTAKMRHQVWHFPALPVSWGANQSGMQADSNLGRVRCWLASKLWTMAARSACVLHLGLEKVGLHKQIANRILEPWQIMKVVVTSTEWANFMWLRDHADAQPEIQELARVLQEAIAASTPKELKIGEWHLPYAPKMSCLGEFGEAQLKNHKAISISCCAQVSYNRDLNSTVERADKIYGMLIDGQRVHASPFEHQATPIGANDNFATEGVTHLDADGNYWSANFKGWIQNRQLLKGHVKW